MLYRLLMEVRFAWSIWLSPKNSGKRHVLKALRNTCRSMYKSIDLDFYK